MNFPDTRANELIVIFTCCLAWLMMARTMRKYDRKNPVGWVIILTCLAVFGYAISLGVAWHPEYQHCTQHCFPWGN